MLLLGCTGDPGSDGSSPVAADESIAASPAPEPRSPEPDPDPEPEPEPEPEPPPPPASRPALEASLDAVVAAAVAAAPRLELGVLVLDEFGREVVSHEPDRPLMPASTAKQVTAAAALTTLGPDARLPTVVDATDGIDGTGRLDGDLIVIGSGDPTLVTDEYARYIYPARPRTPLSSLADQLVAAGLRHVTGDVRGTAPAFAAASLPTGWRDNYLSSLDGRYGAGLTVDGGLRTIIALPDLPDEEDEGDEADGGVDAGSGAGTDAEPRTVEDDDDLDERPVSILDQLAALDTDLPPIVRVSLAEDPVLHTAAELTRLLVERGVVVDGVPTVAPPESPVVARLAVVASPPMDEILRFTVQRSDNHLADALALTVARARTGEGSWTAADRAFGQVLTRFEVSTDGVVFADGSGLSRDDRLTARALTELDRRVTGDPRFGGTWRSLQAVAGRSGTLQRRFVGTPAEGRLLGKTGTLRDVSAFSGQIIGRDADAAGPAPPGERRYHLTIIGNATDTAAGVTRAVVDEVTLALVADLDGCQVVPAGADDGPLGRPPSAVRCAN
ncbi:D-alanyl-D-alanine carboxypeptidase/D-alanyl-D-alanine endopeptidase [Nitriliruptor alkaliphilus]|uniref:D-alanyl-D-alanine carboxypeptidase/D-alanyl-D-alanine endopeptidase n=1 Tax=Nitriliruptor alkaliphilus TaxID=427918 RepID=UPI000AFB0BEC|nr:D-alanyl-D-alanine carboxypeptidase/D-alanyl-D-alanine-endopeptidase [Nitriliruptor alkaliphilus]